jgi:hypothetical protein
MNAIEALNALRNKRFADRTEIEKLIVLMWEEVNGYEDIAMKAAAELAQLQVELAAAREVLEKLWANRDHFHPDDIGEIILSDVVAAELVALQETAKHAVVK